MSTNKPIIDLLNGNKTDRLPIWIMRQAGRYLPEYREVRSRCNGFLDLCYSPKLASEVTLQPLRRFDLDASIIFSDILVIPHALGQSVEFVEGEGPKLEPITNASELKRLSNKLDMSKVSKVQEAIQLVKADLPKHIGLIGFCGAPWTVATYMVAGKGTNDQSPARNWAYQDPEGFKSLIELITEHSIDYLKMQIDAGAEIIQIFDTWAGILSESEMTKWSLEPISQISRELKQYRPDVPIIAFPRGVGTKYASFAALNTIDGLGCDWTLPTSFIKSDIQNRKVTQGNLDPLALVAGGDSLTKAVENILEDLTVGQHIFNLGHGIVPQTPINHVEQMITQIRDFDSTTRI